MPGMFRQGYAHPQGVLIQTELTRFGVFAVLGTTPTTGAAGYEKGCIFINTGGSPGPLVYVNTGSNSSATWLNIA